MQNTIPRNAAEIIYDNLWRITVEQAAGVLLSSNGLYTFASEGEVPFTRKAVTLVNLTHEVDPIHGTPDAIVANGYCCNLAALKSYLSQLPQSAWQGLDSHYRQRLQYALGLSEQPESRSEA